MPDRKLKIVSTGAGDPTFEIEIQIESLNGDEEIQLRVEAQVGSHNITALNQSFQISTGRNVKLLSSFTAPDVGSDPIPATITFSCNDNLIILDQTGLGGTISNNQISFTNITHIIPTSPVLGQEENIGLHSRKGNGNKVFLISDNTPTNIVNLEGESILLTDDSDSTWNLVSVNSVPNQLYYIKQGGNYLVLSNGALQWQQSVPDNNGRWVFMPTSNQLYEVYNNQTTDYLILDTDTGLVTLAMGQPCLWYLHVL